MPCELEHCHCVTDSKTGQELFEGLRVTRNAEQGFDVLMDTVTWLQCPAKEGLLFLRAGMSHDLIRHVVWHFTHGVSVGVALGRADMARDMQNLLAEATAKQGS